MSRKWWWHGLRALLATTLAICLGTMAVQGESLTIPPFWLMLAGAVVLINGAFESIASVLAWKLAKLKKELGQ